MDVERKFELVKRNTEEIVTEKEMKDLIRTKKKISAYYGTAPTGPFHMGYLIPLSKVFDFNKVGITTKILIADIHAALDDLKTPWEEIDIRAKYYKKCIEFAFPWDKKPKFVIGSSFQFNKEYIHDVLKIASIMTAKRATRAASEVCRLKNPKVSELIYPIMQSLDEIGLNVDIQIGGIDQRHILMAAREYLPKIGYKQRVELMTPLVASLKGPGTKMSASIPDSNIKVYDSEKQINEKINKAYCPEGISKENPVLQLCQYIIFPIKKILKIERPSKFGGDITYNSFEKLERDFINKKMHPADLKKAVGRELVNLFSKSRKYFEKHRNDLKAMGDKFLP